MDLFKPNTFITFITEPHTIISKLERPKYTEGGKPLVCDVRRLMQVQNQLQPLYFIYNKVEKTIFEFREMSQNATLVVRGGARLYCRAILLAAEA